MPDMLAVLRDTVERAGALHRVDPGAAVDQVASVAADDHVVARAAVELVVAGAADDEVVSGATRDRVIAVLAVDRVVAGETLDRVVPAEAVDDVEVLRTRDPIGCGGAGEAADIRAACEARADVGAADVDAPAPALLSGRDRNQCVVGDQRGGEYGCTSSTSLRATPPSSGFT
jgi:hypothetical protein